jgi:S-adenosylmethionine synthetase
MLFSSEAVSAGHPDKVCDKIADYVLDSYIRQDPLSHVACEVTATKNLILVTGEVSSSGTDIDIEQSVKTVLDEIGYGYWYENEKIEILNRMGKQSAQICNAVGKGEEVAAGDQGIMFGYACNDTDNYMPLAHALSFELIEAIQNDINDGRSSDWDSAFKPDLKTQVTVDDTDGSIDTILISVCHKESFDLNGIHEYVNRRIITPFKDKYKKRITDKTKYYINPAGVWTDGGFFFDTGLSGRKIVVDNYGGYCPVGGGSFSGKDPSKVDRSAAYFARYLAKNIVAKKGCKECLIQMAFGIGLVQPISVCAKIDNKVFDLTKELDVDMSVTGIINRLDLRNPIYYETASGGHFGRNKFSWEKLDLYL